MSGKSEKTNTSIMNKPMEDKMGAMVLTGVFIVILPVMAYIGDRI
jgi:hypothetical protein